MRTLSSEPESEPEPEPECWPGAGAGAGAGADQKCHGSASLENGFLGVGGFGCHESVPPQTKLRGGALDRKETTKVMSVIASSFIVMNIRC